MADEKMVNKSLTQRQIEVCLTALQMLEKSLERRVVAENDAESRAVWQRKKDEASILASKLRLT